MIFQQRQLLVCSYLYRVNCVVNWRYEDVTFKVIISWLCPLLDGFVMILSQAGIIFALHSMDGDSNTIYWTVIQCCQPGWQHAKSQYNPGPVAGLWSLRAAGGREASPLSFLFSPLTEFLQGRWFRQSCLLLHVGLAWNEGNEELALALGIWMCETSEKAFRTIGEYSHVYFNEQTIKTYLM